MSRTPAEKRAAFRALHTDGCFILPNPWDVGSARVLEGLGFQALATTSSGHAWSIAHRDGTVTREATLAHLRTMAAATDLPVNADFEGGFGADPEGVAQSVRLAIDTGIAAISIEDSTYDPERPVRDPADAVARLRAARAAIEAAGGDVLLVGRAENFFVGRPDLDDTLRRLEAYAAAGADCLYAPGLRTREQIAAAVAAVAPKPVNLLVGWRSELTLAEIRALGVRRISVGGALARAAWASFLRAARGLAEDSFDGLEGIATGSEVNGLFR